MTLRNARLEEKTDRDSALINAAALYEIAGYQANAVCLSRQLFRKADEREIGEIWVLCAKFLQRLFVQVMSVGNFLTKEPSVDNSAEMLRAAATSLLAIGLSEASRYFLSGDDRYVAASLDRLRVAQKGFASLGLVREANVTSTFKSMLPIMARSIDLVTFGPISPR